MTLGDLEDCAEQGGVVAAARASPGEQGSGGSLDLRSEVTAAA